jgi:hypothetical protein
MAQPPNIRRIRSEDFDKEDQGLVQKLAYAINEFMDQTIFVLDGRVDSRNLNQQIVDINVRTDGAGDLINPPSIRTTVNGKVIGLTVINATNLNNPNTIPTSQPFLQFTLVTNGVNILQASGLQANSEYRLKVLLIGDNIG